jgi:hypothetical protein
MPTKLTFQSGHEVIVLESFHEVDKGLTDIYGDGFVKLRRDVGNGEIPITVNPVTVAYVEGLPELTQIGNVFG